MGHSHNVHMEQHSTFHFLFCQLLGKCKRKQHVRKGVHRLSKNLGKGKAHPLQTMQAQRGLGELRLPDFLTSALYGGRSSATRTDRLYPQGHPWYSFSRGAESTPGRKEGHMSLRNPVTRPGIDPGTVRLLAQRLNHYATPGPLKI
jgi:hypothetical protein